MLDQAKLQAALELLASKGVTPGRAAPPIVRLAWRIGLGIPPPLLATFGEAVLVFAAPFAVVACLASLLSPYAHGSLATSLLPAALSGCAFGVAMAAFVRRQARKLGLPLWRDFHTANEAAAPGARSKGAIAGWAFGLVLVLLIVVLSVVYFGKTTRNPASPSAPLRDPEVISIADLDASPPSSRDAWCRSHSRTAADAVTLIRAPGTPARVACLEMMLTSPGLEPRRPEVASALEASCAEGRLPSCQIIATVSKDGARLPVSTTFAAAVDRLLGDPAIPKSGDTPTVLATLALTYAPEPSLLVRKYARSSEPWAPALLVAAASESELAAAIVAGRRKTAGLSKALLAMVAQETDQADKAERVLELTRDAKLRRALRNVRARLARDRLRAEAAERREERARYARAFQCTSGACREYLKTFGRCATTVNGRGGSIQDSYEVCTAQLDVPASCRDCSDEFGGPLGAMKYVRDNLER